MSINPGRLLVVLVFLSLLVAVPHPACAQFGRDPATDTRLDAEQVRNAIRNGVTYLKSMQQGNGEWGNYERYFGGSTALATLALLNAGVPAADPAIERAIDRLLALPDPKLSTYVVALRIMVLAAADPGAKRYKLEVARDARWLLDRQIRDGTYVGGWGYGLGMGTSADSSNSQFALLGLHEASRLGVKIDDQYWLKAVTYWTNAFSQRGGGFMYNVGRGGFNRPQVTGSMTCAGISSLIIAVENLADPEQFLQGGRVACCISNPETAMVEQAIDWIARNFGVRGNPVGRRRGDSSSQFYFLYGMERAGRLAGRRFFGQHDWYRAGAKQLITQQRLNGSWQGTGRLGEADANIATSFALLFLSKGKRPIAIGKLKFGQTNDWNLHPKGVHFLTRELETQWDTKLNWQTIRSDGATVQDLLEAPVLFLSGRDELDFDDRLKKELKRYVESGGFIFAEAAQGDGCRVNAAFDVKFRQLMAELFPDSKLELLPQDHPIWSSHFLLNPTDSTWPLLGLQACCRTSVVYVPRSLSCRWQLKQPSLFAQLPKQPKDEVDFVTQIGVNVVAYATGRQLRDKLDIPQVVSEQKEFEADRILVLPKLSHSGGSDDAPNAWRNVLNRIDAMGMRIQTKKSVIAPTLDNLSEHPFVFMHGRSRFRFDEQQREDLQTYFEMGGTLFADSICKSAPFTESFRSEMKKIFPDHPLTPIPADDPIWSGQRYGGFDVRSVTITKPDRNSPGGFQKRAAAPQLEGIKIDGHYVVIFSSYDISCAMENAALSQCEGYTRDDAAKIAVNIIMYALNRD